jgi:Holliday junction resolvase
VDGNHREIRTQLRSAGYRVFDTSSHGEGFPDLVVPLKNGRVALLFEIKPEEGGQVTKDECTFMMQIVESVYRMADTFEKIDAILQTVERN